MLTAFYENEFGIFNHFNEEHRKSRPLASVAMFGIEDINKGSLLEEMLGIYSNVSIWDNYKLNFLDFINLPKDVCAMIIEQCINKTSKKNSDFGNISNSIKKELEA